MPGRRLAAIVALAAAFAGALTGWAIRGEAQSDLAALKAEFRRPAAVPFPAGNAYTDAKAALGRALFFDPRLSGGGTLACAGCHDPAKGWSDGRKTARGERGQELRRRTPALWDLAWAETLFWDGRAASLEHQSLMPIDSPDEMNRRPDELAAWLDADPAYRTAFRAAFPDAPRVTKAEIAAALATYERTLVSPPTAFDRWIDGDEAAIGDPAKRGFRLFTGKANCAACHKGWAFTDNAFHDIGLPGEDRGRGFVLSLPAAHFAFKTPGLRDLARRGPFMHDGSIATLAAVIAHYETGIVRRATLSRDLKTIALTDTERADLLAFLDTLSTAAPVNTAPPVRAVTSRAALGPAADTRVVAQRDRAFLPGHIRAARGAEILIRNDDNTTHNVRVHHPKLVSDTGAQEPGEIARLTFPEAGRYTVFCGIHPTMKLVVEVE